MERKKKGGTFPGCEGKGVITWPKTRGLRQQRERGGEKPVYGRGPNRSFRGGEMEPVFSLFLSTRKEVSQQKEGRASPKRVAIAIFVFERAPKKNQKKKKNHDFRKGGQR